MGKLILVNIGFWIRDLFIIYYLSFSYFGQIKYNLTTIEIKFLFFQIDLLQSNFFAQSKTMMLFCNTLNGIEFSSYIQSNNITQNLIVEKEFDERMFLKKQTKFYHIYH